MNEYTERETARDTQIHVYFDFDKVHFCKIN